MPFFLILLALLPIIEIALFAAVGREVGVINTLLLCILSAVIGGILVKRQGFKTLASMQDAMDHGELPMNHIFDGIALYAAGILFMLPGFFTDFLAFLLLLPPLRQALRLWLGRYFIGEPFSFRTSQKRADTADVIDVEFSQVPDPQDPITKRIP